MAGLLDQTRVDWMRTPFVWGKSDCALSVLEYVCTVLGRRPATLPSWDSAQGAQDLLQRMGGLVETVAPVMSELGLEETSSPAPGDVGIVNVRAMGPTCAIFCGKKWMMRGDYGVLMSGRIEIMCAWRVV